MKHENLPQGFSFEIIKKSKTSQARVGRLETPHGTIHTPNFVGVGTNGSMKAIPNNITSNMNLDLMFCNTYHLILQPGTEVISQAGGLHKFINYNKPIITDSGGFQVFSLAYGSVYDELKSRGKNKSNSLVLKIDEQGVVFRSYRDGSVINLTPESSVLAQQKMLSDIIIPLDELPGYHVSDEALLKSFERTHRWMLRSLNQHFSLSLPQIMYGVVHGGMSLDLREKSVDFLYKNGFQGLAMGGSLGKNHSELAYLVDNCTKIMPQELPRHLLGIADSLGMDIAIKGGFDTFDSSYPTKIARHGTLLTKNGYIKIRQSIYNKVREPIDPQCECQTCQYYKLDYLHHLYKAHEPCFMQLASIHNLQQMINKSKQYREDILNNKI